MKLFLILTLISIMASISGDHYIDFSQETPDSQWRIVNDGVMGGLSQGQFILAEDHGIFQGTLSLENNGGFSWAKSFTRLENLEGKTKVRLRVKGDGRKYAFTVETDRARSVAYYGASFTAPNDEWMEITLNAEDLRLNYFGRDMGQTLEDLSPAVQIGIILADKKEGPFRLEVDYVDMM